MSARRLPWLLAAIAALFWSAAHLVAHRPRGWPGMNVWGEWDFLLTAQAIAAGRAPDAVIGAMHGNELGSYVVASKVAPFVAMGTDAVVVAKWLALGFGALTAAITAWLATWLALRAGLSRRDAWTAGGFVALLLAFAWPGLHFELAGLSGRTPESVPVQLLAVTLVVTGRGLVGGRLMRRAALAGVLLGAGWLFSPVALWSAALCGVLAMVVLETWPARGRALGAALLGMAVPFLVFAVGVPGGMEGLGAFRVEQLGGPPPGDGGRLGLGFLGLVHGALEGGAHNPALSLRPVALTVLGWALVLAPVGVLARAVRRRGAPPGMRWFDEPTFLVAAAALSWLIPLASLDTDRWFYPLAYRYWVPMLCLGAAVLPTVLLLRPGKAGRAALGVLGLAVLVCVGSLPRSVVAPAPSRAEALVAATAHAMGPRAGRDRHAAFWALVPHARKEDQPALAEGYGLMLGADLAVDVRDGREIVPPWESVAPRLPEPGRTRFLVGVGCGLAASGEVPAGAVQRVMEAPTPGRLALQWGLGRCWGEGAVPGALAADPAFAKGRAAEPMRGIRSTVADPKPLLPPRW